MLKKIEKILKSRFLKPLQDPAIPKGKMIAGSCFAIGLMIFIVSSLVGVIHGSRDDASPFENTVITESMEAERSVNTVDTEYVSIKQENEASSLSLESIILAGAEYELPFSFQTLLDNGYRTDFSNVIMNNDTRAITASGAVPSFQVTAKNNTGDVAKVEACDVVMLTFQKENGDLPVYLPSNLGFSSKADDFINAFGTPDDESEVAGIKTYKWLDSENDTFLSVNFSAITGEANTVMIGYDA